MVLAFFLGAAGGIARSDLKVPEAVYDAVSIYLLFAIGLKGGAALAEASPAAFWKPASITVLLGAAIPLWSYLVIKRLGKFSTADAAALAAHYGSVSAVTFMAAMGFLQSRGVSFEGFMPSLMAILEVPAILVALLIFRVKQKNEGVEGNISEALREVVFGKSILLLTGGLFIGLVSGKEGFAKVEPFFGAPFAGVLALFLLELGRMAAGRWGDLRTRRGFLLLFGIAAPLVHGMLGSAAGLWAGLSTGGATLLAVLTASASYIAAPAAVRVAIPQANPAFYLTSALAITFPFNLLAGIPIYYGFTSWLAGGG